MNNKRILAIETSCDETAAAVVEAVYHEQSRGDATQIKPLSSVVYSQIDLHKKFGGVYPELASREHIKKIRPVVEQALDEAKVTSGMWHVASKNSHLTPVTCSPVTKADLDAIAVTVGPGLAGSLIVGVEFARGLSASSNLPVVPVNHLEGHIFASYTSSSSNLKSQISKLLINEPEFPALALIVSGGHTMLVFMQDHLSYEIIGTTQDDAAGECFDKVARMLGLPYPGGPALSKLAEGGDAKAFDFPRSMLNSGDNNFSFSGLKTSVFYKLRELSLVDDKAEPLANAKVSSDRYNVASRNSHLTPDTCSLSTKADIAASAQAAIVDVLVAKTFRAAADLKVKSILVGGGVSANSALREKFIHESKIMNLKSYLSPLELTGDNALSIAIAAAYRLKNGNTVSWHDLDTNASLRLQ